MPIIQEDFQRKRFDYLCTSCGALLNCDDSDEVKYDCLDPYSATINDDHEFKLKDGSSYICSQEALKQILDSIKKKAKLAKDYSKRLETKNETKNDEKQELAINIPALTELDLYNMAKALLGVGIITEPIENLSECDPQSDKEVAPMKKWSVLVENGVIRNVYERDASFSIFRRCPKCGELIDSRAGAYKEIRIGVIGTPRQGKSALLTASIQAFSDQEEKYGILLDADEENDKYLFFKENYLNPYNNNISIVKTEETDTLAYRFTLNISNKKRNILFIDIAGELLQPHKRDSFLKHYSFFMKHIDCFWMCTDFFQICNLKEAPPALGLGAEKRVDNYIIGPGAQRDLLSVLGADKEIPFAVIVVKSDTINQNDREAMYSGLTENNGLYCFQDNCLIEKEIYRLREQVRYYISSNNERMAPIFEEFFSYVGYLACSAYGHAVASFNVAYGKEEILLYVPESVHSALFTPERQYDIELHLGERLSINTEREMIEKESYAAGCKVETVQLRKEHDIYSFSAMAIRIPIKLSKICTEENCGGIIRLLEHDDNRMSNGQWKTKSENTNSFYIVFPKSLFEEIEPEANKYMKNNKKLYLQANDQSEPGQSADRNKEICMYVEDRPKPDQIAAPLLWTLAMLGEYRTLGEVEQYNRFWDLLFRKRKTRIKIKSFLNDADSRKVFCGKKYRHE